MGKSEWKRFLPKSKREQNEIWEKSMMFGSSLWKDYVNDKEDAVRLVEEILSVIHRKELDEDVAFAVILEQADKKLGDNEGVQLLKEVLEEVLNRNKSR